MTPDARKAAASVATYFEAEREYSLALDHYESLEIPSSREEQEMDAAREWALTTAHEALYNLRDVVRNDSTGAMLALADFFQEGADQ